MSSTALTALPLRDAVRRVEAGMAQADELGVRVNLALVDAGGHLEHFCRMDGAWLGSIDIAMRKARTAALFQTSTAALGEISQPGGPVYGIEWSNSGLVSFGGGLPITDDSGLLIGAVGVSGGTVAEDIQIAEAVAKAD